MSKQEARVLMEEAKVKASSLGGFQKFALVAICGLFVVSIVCRLAFSGEGGGSGVQDSNVAISSLLPGGTAPEYKSGQESGADAGTLEALLPFFTEASFFAMIGFALGYATRKVLKLAMIGLAVFFVLLQLMTYGGVTTIDWARFVEILNDWILNLKENQSITDVLTDRVPTAGSLIGGYFLGFRRG